MLEPGTMIRPIMTEATARHLVEDLYGFKVTSIKELNSYDDKNYKVTVAGEHTNPNVTKIWPDGYTLKVLNSMDTLKEHIAAEHKAQALLWASGIWCPQPVLDLQGRDRSRQKVFTDSNYNEDKIKAPPAEERPFKLHTVRLLTFIAGDVIDAYDITPRMLQETGCFLSQIHETLKDFSHPALASHETVWNLSQIPRLSEFMFAIQDDRQKAVFEEVMEVFSGQVLPSLSRFQMGTIHGDFNEHNLLVKQSDSGDELVIAGILDFGDLAQSYLLFDVAIAIAYMSVVCRPGPDQMRAGGHVIAGFLRQGRRRLNVVEWRHLATCVAARYCQSLVMGAYSYSLNPCNQYLLVTARAGWVMLDELWRTPREELYRIWFDIIRKEEPEVQLPNMEEII